MNPDKVNIKILIVNGSPRKKSNTSILVHDTEEGALTNSNVQTEIYNFAGKNFTPCKGDCASFHQKNGYCCLKDDFNNFAKMWLQSDAIIYATPVYHMSTPSCLRSAMERLGAITFGYARYAKVDMPRFNKVIGVIAQGHTLYGGQELTIMNLITHVFCMNCIPVTGKKPYSYVGVGAQVNSEDHLRNNKEARENARELGRRVIEMEKIIKIGIRDYNSEKIILEYNFMRDFSFPP
ncbi:MAG: flavodoxin family protein [Bacteroidetes bacterium]|nr:flavodoxin family protein [Bacteroidota bacterium]